MNAVADPEHEPAILGEGDHRLHDRRKARNRPRPEIVAVGEPARHDDRVDAFQVALGVPQQLGVTDAPRRVERIDLIASAGKLEYAEPHGRLVENRTRVARAVSVAGEDDLIVLY